jgi:hypothetical protein
MRHSEALCAECFGYLTLNITYDIYRSTSKYFFYQFFYIDNNSIFITR